MFVFHNFQKQQLKIAMLNIVLFSLFVCVSIVASDPNIVATQYGLVKGMLVDSVRIWRGKH